MAKKVLAISLLVFLLFSFCSYGEGEDEIPSLYERAVILETFDGGDVSNDNIESIQYVELKVTTGKYKGEVFNIENTLSGHPVYDIPVKPGDKVLVLIEEYEDGSLVVNIADYIRDFYIYILAGVFALSLLVIGKSKGLKTIITLVFTMFMIFKVLLPLMLRGYNPVAITILISVVITVLTILLISGITKKSFAAILGTVSGVLIAGFLAFVIGTKVRLTGMTSEEAVMLLYIPQNIKFNFKELLFSGILLGALGAVMDVCMSIASSIEEVNRANTDLTMKELFLSGMNVGKDIMGTMSNTLILAYTGSAVPLLLLFMAYETSILRIINLDIIATEVVRSLAGSIGLILSIPITAILAAVLIKREGKGQ
ncbi:YibE/F family protein [Wukongibacter baidiensis]|uniref:YibE/F family protein n=1 Tax=Wukongibacter baidiensis TaxID=1723361 RepID=UPI003D7FB567